jgi:hypothetical protein
MRQMESLLQVDGAPCIQFRERLVADQIYITIRNGSGCSAHVYNKIFLIIFEKKNNFLYILGWIS